MASSEDRSTGDVDLMIIGSAGLAEIAAALRSVEPRLGRSVNPAVYTPVEFARKLKSGANFLKNVRAGKKLFIIGSEDDLASTLGERAHQAAYDEPSRDL